MEIRKTRANGDEIPPFTTIAPVDDPNRDNFPEPINDDAPPYTHSRHLLASISNRSQEHRPASMAVISGETKGVCISLCFAVRESVCII